MSLTSSPPTTGIPLRAARPERGNLVLSTIAINLLSLALPIMTLQVYDRILPNPESGTLPVLMALVLVAICCEAALRLARAWMMGWTGAVYEHELAARTMNHILGADISRSKSGGIGEFLHRFTAVGHLKDFKNGYITVTAVDLAFIPVFLAVIAYIAPALVAVPLGLMVLFVVVSALQGRRLREKMEQRDKKDDERYNFLIECLKGVHTVKAFALENLISRRYENLQEKSGIASFEAAEATTAVFNFGTMLSHLMMVAVMATGAVAVVAGDITTGALIATLQLSGRLMQPAQRGLSLWARSQEAALSRRKVEEVFALPQIETRAAESLPPPRGNLEIRNLSFRNILHDISLEIAVGDVIAINGAVGSGKTTLLELMAGLYPPDSGTILLDDVDMRHFPPESLPARIGYLATDGVIFQGTIRDNITRFGTLPEESAHEIARLLNVDNDVARLPAGFDTVLQSQGIVQAPPGLRQRIALTRVLASHPKIILFDEADRALDRAGYNLVFSLLARLRRHTAIVLVSDDANITDLATRHYTLRDGRLVKTFRPERKTVS